MELGSRRQHSLRASDIHPVELRRILRPKPVVRRAVIQRRNPCHCRVERRRVRYVPDHNLDVEPRKVVSPTRLPHQAPDSLPLLEQRPHHVRPNKTRPPVTRSTECQLTSPTTSDPPETGNRCFYGGSDDLTPAPRDEGGRVTPYEDRSPARRPATGRLPHGPSRRHLDFAGLSTDPRWTAAGPARPTRGASVQLFGVGLGSYAAKFQATSRTMSPGCFGSSITTEASKPECIAQFLHIGSCRDSQYAQSVPFQNSSNVGDQVFPIR